MLLAHALRWDEDRPAGLNTGHTDTFHHYVDRATWCAKVGYHKPTLDGAYGEGGVAELVARAERELATALHYDELPETMEQGEACRAVLLGIVARPGAVPVVAAAGRRSADGIAG
jgi:hypothetical protein